jgi:hypothetical protein
MSHSVRPGDILLIPVARGPEFAVAKVLFTSLYWKRMMLLGVSMSVTVRAAMLPKPMPRRFDLRIYTLTELVDAGRFIKVGRDARRIDARLTRRLVAGGVWQGDSFVGARGPGDQRLDAQGISCLGDVVFRIQRALGLPKLDFEQLVDDDGVSADRRSSESRWSSRDSSARAPSSRSDIPAR